jgi:hypothetical protein
VWNTVAEKLSNFFGQSFMVAYWGPAAIGMGALFGVLVLIQGFEQTFGWLAGSNTITPIIFFLGIVMAITMLAYLLASFHHFLVRLYEGYWEIPFKEILKKSQTKQAQQQEKKQQRHLHFPLSKDRMMPTRLGNVLAASEEYPFRFYGLDPVTWWPRLVTLLPESMISAVNETEAYMVAALNLSAIFTLFALIGGGTTFLLTQNWGLSLLLVFGGGGLSWLCYVAAVSQAESYGAMIRTAFDLYRHRILMAMHLPLPPNLADERVLWSALNECLQKYIVPWYTAVACYLPQLQEPFSYAPQQEEISGPGSQKDSPKN